MFSSVCVILSTGGGGEGDRVQPVRGYRVHPSQLTLPQAGLPGGDGSVVRGEEDGYPNQVSLPPPPPPQLGLVQHVKDGGPWSVLCRNVNARLSCF